MTSAFVPRFALIWTVIFAMLLANISVATPVEIASNPPPREESRFLTGLPTLVVIGVTSFGRWLTPLDEWQAEIRKLTEDELFVKRWMLVNYDPASLEKANRAISIIQQQRKALEKKRNRFLWWYYPTITVVGAGAMMLTFWLQKD